MPARASWVPYTWLERPAHSETTELGPSILTEIIGKPASDALTGIAPSARSADRGGCAHVIIRHACRV